MQGLKFDPGHGTEPTCCAVQPKAILKNKPVSILFKSSFLKKNYLTKFTKINDGFSWHEDFGKVQPP